LQPGGAVSLDLHDPKKVKVFSPVIRSLLFLLAAFMTAVSISPELCLAADSTPESNSSSLPVPVSSSSSNQSSSSNPPSSNPSSPSQTPSSPIPSASAVAPSKPRDLPAAQSFSPLFAQLSTPFFKQSVSESFTHLISQSVTYSITQSISPSLISIATGFRPNSPTAPKTPSVEDPAILFPIGSKFSRTVQKVTGITFLSDVIAGQAAKRVLQKKLGGKVKVKVKTFGLTDLVAGKIKSVSVSSAGGSYKSVPIGAVQMASESPIWYQYKHKDGQKSGLKTPILFNVKGNLSTQDVIVALGSERIAKSLRGLRLDLPGLGDQQLQVVRPKVEIGDNELKIDAVLVTEGAAEETGVPIKISGRPVLEGEKIYLRQMKVESPDIIEPEKFAAFAEELLNPIVDFSRMDRPDRAFRLKELAIEKDVVHGGGQLLIAPRTDAAVAQSSHASK
jgi:hypothetical protein